MSASTDPIYEQVESSVRSYCRQFTGVFGRANGAEVWTKDGDRYLDFLSGCGALNYGHNNPHMKEALINYVSSDGITHAMDLNTEAKSEFLTAFRDHILAPRGMNYVLQFPGPTGANAVEAAFKLARKLTGRSNIVSFTNGFHGVTLGALTATGNRYHRTAAGVPLSGGSVMPYDGYFGSEFDTIKYFEKFLDDPSSGLDIPAAVIVETVQGEGGLTAARVEWLQMLQDVCNRYDILLIADEIQAGCGRTGSFFGFEPAGITPDMVTMAKSISGYGLPMALTLIREPLDIWSPGEHNGTFRGNNHAFVTATAAIRHYWQDNRFIEQIAARSISLSSGLAQIAERFHGDIQDIPGRGMMQGLRFNDPIIAGKVASAAFDRGLIIERAGPRDEVVKFLAPLTISEEHLDEGVSIVEDAVASQTTGKSVRGLVRVH